MSRTGSATYKFSEDLKKDRTISPLFGVVDNYFAVMMIETGIPGTLLITGILLYFIIKGYLIQITIKEKELKIIAASITTFLLSLFIISFGYQKSSNGCSNYF